LFWFESGSLLQYIESGAASQTSSPLDVSTNVIPSPGFRQWVTNLLSTTQVTQNVILLALLFIYKLKMRNSTVQGQLGSECRLLTVALMLGNKFLDDNTYTNKTWAEVSSINIEEVHIMEVEFLSNMRYNLFTSQQEWKEWHVTLGKFGTFISNFIKSRELAARLRPLQTSMASNGLLPAVLSPVSQMIPSYSAAPYNGHLSSTVTPVLQPQVPSSAISPIGPLPAPEMPVSRKRGLDDSPSERATKRHLSNVLSSTSCPPATSVPNLSTSGPLKVNLPSLVIPPFSTLSTPNQLTPTLPPLGTHAMSLVYQAPHPRHPRDYHSGIITPIQSTPSLDSLKQLSPFPTSSANSSPISTNFANRLSPSYYLDKRSSPYRPVRRVQHLITNQGGPPPLFNSSRRIGLEQMQYHSLGQPLNERHTGHLPYINNHPWSQRQAMQNTWSPAHPSA
jgi:cyclin-like protein